MEPEGLLPCSQEPASILRPCVIFRNKLLFTVKILAHCPTPKLEDQPLSAVRDCLLRMSGGCPPFAFQGLAMPWWQGLNMDNLHVS
jgi:hypothetical protein